MSTAHAGCVIVWRAFATWGPRNSIDVTSSLSQDGVRRAYSLENAPRPNTTTRCVKVVTARQTLARKAQQELRYVAPVPHKLSRPEMLRRPAAQPLLKPFHVQIDHGCDVQRQQLRD